MIYDILLLIESDEEREAVEAIIDLYYEVVRTKAWHILQNEEDAKDAAQETFLNISKNPRLFMDPYSDDTIALVHVYAKNVAINMYNRKKRYNKLFDSEVEVGDMPARDYDGWGEVEEIIVNEETIDIVRDALSHLDDEQRDVILLKYYYGKKNIEIAEQLDIDVNLVNGRIFRAKKNLRKLIGDEGYERITNK